MDEKPEDENPWIEYERLKKELPILPPDQYTLAVCAIAEELGI